MKCPTKQLASGGSIESLWKKLQEVIDYLPSLQVIGDNKITSVSSTSRGQIIKVKVPPTRPKQNVTADDEFPCFTPWSYFLDTSTAQKDEKTGAWKGGYFGLYPYSRARTLGVLSGYPWYSQSPNDVGMPLIEINSMITQAQTLTLSAKFSASKVPSDSLYLMLKASYSSSTHEISYETVVDTLDNLDIDADKDFDELIEDDITYSYDVLGMVKWQGLKTDPKLYSYDVNMPHITLAASLTPEELNLQ